MAHSNEQAAIEIVQGEREAIVASAIATCKSQDGVSYCGLYKCLWSGNVELVTGGERLELQLQQRTAGGVLGLLCREKGRYLEKSVGDLVVVVVR